MKVRGAQHACHPEPVEGLSGAAFSPHQVRDILLWSYPERRRRVRRKRKDGGYCSACTTAPSRSAGQPCRLRASFRRWPCAIPAANGSSPFLRAQKGAQKGRNDQSTISSPFHTDPAPVRRAARAVLIVDSHAQMLAP